MLTFSENLKKVMSARGVTQRWLAKATNTTEATISRYINEVHKPNSKLAVKIAEALDVSVDYLLGAATEQEASDRIKETDILIGCYKRATKREKRLIWGILEEYLSEDEKNSISKKLL